MAWALLQSRKYDEFKKLTFDSLTAKELHPKQRNTWLVEAVNSGFASENLEEVEGNLRTIDWLIMAGASASQKCCDPTRSRCFSMCDRGNGKELNVWYDGKSAISYITSWQAKLQNELLNSNWSDELDYLDKALERIARASNTEKRPKVLIDEGILENWERCLRATCSHDLTLDTADGPVTAHAVILKEASPVIKAMLGSPMKEQETQHVQVKDSPKAGVSLFLETLYTCSTSTEPDYHTVLSALDLAHRWQVHVVVAILTDLLGTMITEESFPPIAEHAALKGLEPLKKACRRFGHDSWVIQQQLKKGRLSRVVRELLLQEAAGTARSVRKRKLL